MYYLYFKGSFIKKFQRWQVSMVKTNQFLRWTTVVCIFLVAHLCFDRVQLTFGEFKSNPDKKYRDVWDGLDSL